MNGLFSNPWIQVGLGILGASKPGVPGSQALGQGGLLGLESIRRQREADQMQQYRQAQAQAQQQQMAQAQQKQAMEMAERERQAQFSAEIARRAASGEPMTLEEMAALQAAHTGSYAPMIGVAEGERDTMNRMNEAAYRHELASNLATQRAAQQRGLAQYQHSLSGGGQGRKYALQAEVQIQPDGSWKNINRDPRTGERTYASTGAPIDYGAGRIVSRPSVQAASTEDLGLTTKVKGQLQEQQVVGEIAVKELDSLIGLTEKATNYAGLPGAMNEAGSAVAGWADQMIGTDLKMLVENPAAERIRNSSRIMRATLLPILTGDERFTEGDVKRADEAFRVLSVFSDDKQAREALITLRDVMTERLSVGEAALGGQRGGTAPRRPQDLAPGEEGEFDGVRWRMNPKTKRLEKWEEE